MKSYQALQQKRDFIKDKNIIGVDPAKAKHQVAIIDKDGIQQGKSFYFLNNYQDYNKTLWDKTSIQIPELFPENTVFAIETSCNLWQNLSFFLFSKGYTVLLVSPLTTHQSRSLINHDFSKTDPKDALLVASNAQQGYFDFYKNYSPLINAMHTLSITYYKLNRNLRQNRARLRALIEHVFPEFLSVLQPDTDTALYLLKKYILPQDFADMNITSEAIVISRISRKQHGFNTLVQLKKLACNSIGVNKQLDEIIAIRLSLDAWLILIDTLEKQCHTVMEKLISLAKLTPYFDIISSLKGISDKSAAPFIAEIRDLSLFNHFKQIEKSAGFNLRLSQSGQSSSYKHISHIGNKRLNMIIYKMTEETSKYIPEIRIKFLKRQIKRKNHRKNVTACVPNLLKLIFKLVNDNRFYEEKNKNVQELALLEAQYQKIIKKNNPEIAA